MTGRLVRRVLSLALLVPLRLAAQVAPEAESAMPGMMAPGPLGISRDRDGSGTSWIPDATPMAAVHAQSGSWELMLHGNIFVQYIEQRSRRVSSQFGSINWLMGMAQRPWAGGDFGFRAMMSAEPFTIPGCGYPLLLQTGETCDGESIHDAQHPHDLFMELAVKYERPITDRVALQVYGGPAGEPALGPVAFPHRPSALTNPLAPISHHWFDATHISFGVVTGGIYGKGWKVEGSLFNGREPDENRRDLDLARLDSYAGRLWLMPSDRWAIQASAGKLTEAEPAHVAGDPRIDVNRYTASATYLRPLTGSGSWASTAAWGRNVEHGEAKDALLLESNLSLAERHLFFGRAEWAEKSGEDLDLLGSEDGSYKVGSLALGYTRQLDSYHGWLPGVGAQASVNFIPSAIEPFYGQSKPGGFGFTIFASLRPAAMVMDMRHDPEEMGTAPMPGMDHAQTNMTQDPGTMPPMAMGDTASGMAMSASGMHEVLMRMVADSVIQGRIMGDPELTRMIEELGMTMDMTMPGGGAMDMAPADRSSEERAIDFIVRLLSNPAVEARIHADPRLERLWNDPAVQSRLRELRDRSPSNR